MKKILTITLIIIIILSVSTIAIINIPKEDGTKNTTIIENTEKIDYKQYENTIEITQQEIQLDYEVIQYKIIFHEDDTINAFFHIKLDWYSQEKKAYFISISDGNNNIMPKISKVELFYFSHIPIGKFEITTPRFKFIGKLPLIYKLVEAGIDYKDSGTIDVEKNDTWYLTVAVIGLKNAIIEVNFESEKKSMELLQIERHSKLGFYSANHNDFDGKYYSISLRNLAISYAKNLNKQIETTKGSIIHFQSLFHRKGDVKIQRPDNKVLSSNTEKAINYFYLGNMTGRWSFTANGRTLFGWKYTVLLFYIDIDPHMKLQI